MKLRLVAGLAITLALLGSGEAVCPQGMIEYKGNCYLFGKTTYSWYIARDICKGRGGILTTIGSIDEQNFLAKNALINGPKDNFWVGTTDAGSEGKWRNIDNSKFVVSWSGGQPDNYGKNEHCGSIMSHMKFKHNDDRCTKTYRYICKRSANYKDPCNFADGWHLLNGKCYKSFKEKQNWQNARKNCQDKNGDLLTVNNDHEKRFVSEAVECETTQPIWLGYSDTGPSRTLAWVDGTPFDDKLKAWDSANGEPNTNKYVKGSNCAAVIPLNKFLWVINNCDTDEREYICEKDQGQCPKGWSSTGNTCYKLNFAVSTWSEAVASCQTYGGKLSTPDSSWLTSSTLGRYLVTLSRYRIWVGISDTKADGSFADINSNLVDQSVWATGLPKSGDVKGSQDCGYMSNNDRKVRLQSCFATSVYFCEASKDDVLAVPATPPPDNLACYTGWQKNGNSCYKFITTEKTWTAAKADCKNQNADLVTINNAAEQSFLSKSLLNTAWIGLSDAGSPGTWKWTDGTSAAFTNWGPTEPNGDTEHCVEAVQYNAGRWNDHQCTELRDYVCEKDAEPGTGVLTPKPTQPWSTFCGQEWRWDSLSNNCYYFSLDQLSWQDARNACKKKSSELASIISKQEQSYLQGIANGDASLPFFHWIGANDLQNELGWRWSDDQPFRYLNWGDGEPNNLDTENCVEFDKTTGVWNDNKCSGKKNYICKKSSSNPTTPSSATTPLPPIDKDCKTVELISGKHWVPDSAITASSIRDKDSGTANSRLDWTVTDTKVKISTNKVYKYTPVANLHLKGQTSITFTVQACSDVHVSLQPSVDKVQRNAYEIVIGGWGNTRSVIRRQHQGTVQGKPSTKKNVVDCNIAKPFWISWANNIISVGEGNNVDGSTQLMSFNDGKPYQVAGLAVSSGFGSSGVWVINNPHGTRKGAWSPKYSPRKGLPIGQDQTVYNVWIQVNFFKPTLIQTITTQGSASANEYVTEYSITYAYNAQESWDTIKETGTTTSKIFKGNTDATSKVTNTLVTPVEAQIVRIVPKKFMNFPSLRWSVGGCASQRYCKSEPLISGQAYIADNLIRGSSLKSSKYTDCRMGGYRGANPTDGWVANTPLPSSQSIPNEWLQFTFRQDMIISGIRTQGHATQKWWVKTYQVQFRSRDQGYQFINYQEPYGTIKTFNGNKDQNTKVTQRLTNAVLAYSVRIVPRDFNVEIAMRVEILGCLSGCSLSQLINGPRPIDGKRLSASSQVSAGTSAQRGRLYWRKNGNLMGAWVARTTTVGQEFWQVDFGVLENVRAISTQGRDDQPEWVKTYKVAYSIDGKKFRTYYKLGIGTTFTGNFDQKTIVKNFVEIKAQVIRIYPQTYEKKMSMRVEIHGCQGTVPNPLGCFLDSPSASMFDGPGSYISYNSPARCAENCFSNGYMYAGLRRTSCMCGATPPTGGRSTSCTYRCAGDRSNFCGGYTSTAVSIYETGLGPSDERCAVGYKEFQGKCYKLFSKRTGNPPVMWHEARTACRADGGDLATINSKAHQAYLTNQIRYAASSIWIGLNDLREQMSFDWADGTPVLATFWAHGEPNNWLGKKEDCVWATRMTAPSSKVPQNGLWQDVTCDSKAKAAYLCQKDKQRFDTPPPTPAPEKGCPQGWKAYESSCYLFVEHYSVWTTARDTCVKEGGTLARVNDEFEQEFISSELYGMTSSNAPAYRKSLFWTDLKSQPSTNEYVWSNNYDIIPYTHWDKGQPTAFPTVSPSLNRLSTLLARYTTRCVAMNGVKEDNTGYWRVQSCSSGAYPMCEKPRVGFTQPPLPTLSSEDITCPPGWKGVGPNCYQINKPDIPADRKGWMDAEKHCIDQGTHLAYINNGTEMDNLWRNFLLDSDDKVTESFWIGLNERGGTGYKWISGDPLSYTNWDDGEPNDWFGKEPCVLVKPTSGKWNDQICNQLNNWVCSIPRADSKKGIKTIKTTVAPTAGPPGSCPDGDNWKFFGGNCYLLNDQRLSWQAASDYCNKNGGHLASIHSETENSFIQSQAKTLFTNLYGRNWHDAGSFGDHVWIGLNELDRSKGHIWSDGQSYNFAKWKENEPNDHKGGEYCVGMRLINGMGIVHLSLSPQSDCPIDETGFQYDARKLFIHLGTAPCEWNDDHCSRTFPSVCEKPKDQTGPITTPKPPKISGYCPTGYIDFENDCYKIVVDKKTNRSNAEFHCETEGGHLTHILNNREQTFLTSLLPMAKEASTELWIGLDHLHTGKQRAVTFKWAANKDISFTNWNIGEPNGNFEEPCTEMLYNPAGRWNDVSCANDRGYICRKPKDGTINTPPTSDTSNCPSGYVRWSDACYKLQSNPGTWDFIDHSTCGESGAHLVSIQSPYEQAYIQTMLWKNNIETDIWIGLSSKANLNYFQWSNQWPVVITNWGKGEPSNFKTNQGCVVMKGGDLSDSGTWEHVSCTEQHTGVCKKTLSPPPFPTPASGICPSAGNEQWLANSDGYCYLFWLDPIYTFNDASATCRATGGNLASIHTKDDTAFISTHIEHMQPMNGGTTKAAWIGLVKEANGGYSWTDGTAVYYANWASNEPNDVDNKEKCVELWPGQAEWNDQECQVKRGFICKIKQGQQPQLLPTPSPPLSSSVGPTTTRSPTVCQLDGWNYYNGSCYALITDRSNLKHWGEAEVFCRAPGREAHLVSIGSEPENQWITEKLLPRVESGTDVWIGLAEFRDNTLKWTDNSIISLINWDDGQPQTNTGSQECTAMEINGLVPGAAGRWATEYCFDKKAFICERDPTIDVTATVSTTVTDGRACSFPFTYRGQKFNNCTTYGASYLWCATTPSYEDDGKFAICDPFACPSGWLRHGRICYYFSPQNDLRSWTGAEASCAAMGSDLAYIGEPAVQSFITNNIYEYYWIGLHDRRLDNAFEWDHRPGYFVRSGFTNWGINEPRNTHGNEDCAQIVNGPYADGRPGEWIMFNCEIERRYICMKAATGTLSKSTLQPTISIPSTTPIALTTMNQSTVTTVASIGGTEKLDASTPETADISQLRTGEIVAIVIAAIAVAVAVVAIVLYIRKAKPGGFGDNHAKMSVENVSYTKDAGRVHVGLENPNFLSDE